MDGPNIPPESPRARWGPRLLRFGLILVVTALVYRALGGRWQDVMDLERGLVAPDLAWLIGSSVVLLLAYTVAARMWGWMLAELGARDPGMILSVQMLLAANLGRYLPGKVWQLAGLAVLAQRRGLPPVTAVGSSLLVQGFTLAATLVWSIPILVSGVPIGVELEGTVTVALLVLGLVLASIPPITHAAIRLLYRIGRQPTDAAPRPTWHFGGRWLLMNLMLWGLYGFAFVAFVWGLGFEVPIGRTLVAFTASYLIGNLVVVAPAGIGVREVALAGFMLPEIGSAALAVAIWARLWMTALEVGPAAAFAWLEIRGTTT